MQSVTTVHSPGVIDPSALYELDEAGRRLGWGKAAFRTARRQGLPVKYASRKAYVLGSDIIEFIQKNGKDEK